METGSENGSVLGRLLEEISWEGRTVRRYRDGGRGLENVLTAEVLTALDFLPRKAFLGSVLRAAQGAPAVRTLLADEVEDAVITFLPEETVLNPDGPSRGEQLIVQPDAMVASPSCLMMIEAKRIRTNSFQPQQLAREYLALTRESGERTPLLLLVIGTPPPLAIKGAGRMSVADSIQRYLPELHPRSGHPLPLADLTARISDVCAWITWDELAGTVSDQRAGFVTDDASVAGSVARLAGAVTRAVAHHA